MATDPVCGMEVKSPAENFIEYNGAKYEFCSPTCKGKFEAEPSRYLSTQPA
ncbi:MAG: YHS domain-containing protein, partial [bacterium]